MTTSEPTTGEIVRALRFCYESEEIECYECPCRVSGGAYLCHMDKLADRFESQERENEELKAEAIVNALENAERIANLTARAEQAEKERNLAVNALTVYEDALFDECDKSYQSGYMDGYTQRGEQDDDY